MSLGDIDLFKKINDQYGHVQGDLVLEEVGKTHFTNNTYRFLTLWEDMGGEEFLFIFEETDTKDTFNIIERPQRRDKYP